MDDAAANGHLEIVQWLHANRSEGCTPAAANYAAQAGHLAVVQWLFENRSEGNLNETMAYAAASGELDVMRSCLDHSGCARCVKLRVLTQPKAYNGGLRTLFDARPVHALQWLSTLEGCTGCTGQCVRFDEWSASTNLAVVAVGSGDLLLSEYLHEHHRDLFSWLNAQVEAALHLIVCQGHVRPIQWLHTRFPSSLDWRRGATIADQRDQTEVAKWLRGATRRMRGATRFATSSRPQLA